MAYMTAGMMATTSILVAMTITGQSTINQNQHNNAVSRAGVASSSSWCSGDSISVAMQWR